MNLRVAITFAMLVCIEIGIIALIRFRPDLDARAFLLTYWAPIGLSLLGVLIFWRASRTDD